MSMPEDHHDSDSASRPKRRHESHPPAATQISKHDLLYFTMGDIVIFSIPKDHIITAFKVYKDLLILQSPIFENMLSVPIPSSPNVEEYDNVPLVRLPEKADSLIPFLEAVHDPNAIPLIRDFYVSFKKVETVFKLSKKYQCDKLLKFMCETLSRIWPKMVLVWDAVINNIQAHVGFLMDEYELESPLREPCGAIRIACDYDVPEILPAAFYFLLCLSPDVFCTSNSNNRSVLFGEVEAKLTCLSHDDLICFIQGSHATRKFAYSFFTDSKCVPAEDCTTPTECLKAFQTLGRVHILKAAKSSSLEYDPLEFLQRRSMDFFAKITTKSLCNECCHEFTTKILLWGNDLWESLPKFFGLQDKINPSGMRTCDSQ